MKKILIALDYDPTAQKVAELGFSIVQNQIADVTLLHVLGDPTFYAASAYDPIMGFGGYSNVDFLSLSAIDDLEKTSIHFLENTKQHLGDDSINVMVKHGDTAQTILQTANEINADVIVIGTHSHRWLQSILMGSIAEHVLHHSTIPLFIIPTKKQA